MFRKITKIGFDKTRELQKKVTGTLQKLDGALALFCLDFLIKDTPP